jgi:hypothetical protein
MATPEIEVERNERGSRIFITDPIINPKNIHIVYGKDYDEDDNAIGEHWRVRREGRHEIMAISPTKEEAVNEAKKIKMDDETIIVHNKNASTDFIIQ